MSLQKIQKDFGRNTLQIIESVRLKEPPGNIPEDCETILGTLINEFCANFKNETVIVIDDLHNSTSSWPLAAKAVSMTSLPEARSVPGPCLGIMGKSSGCG